MFFANYLSQSVACLFILLMLSFAEHKFLILMKSSLSIISFMDGAFSAISKKSLLYWRSSIFYSVLSCRSFIVLNFTLRSMICIELIFVKVWVLCLVFFLCVCEKKNVCWKGCLFPIVLPMCLHRRSVTSVYEGLFGGLSVLVLWSICLFFHQNNTVLIAIAL